MKKPWRQSISYDTNVKQLRPCACFESIHTLPAHPFDKLSPTSMGGTVFDPVQDRFWDCTGQRYYSTKSYRTSALRLDNIPIPHAVQSTGLGLIGPLAIA